MDEKLSLRSCMEDAGCAEASIRRAEKALADLERTPQIRREAEKALAAWREQNGLQKAAEINPAEPVQAEVADVPPAQAAATPSSAMPE